MNFLKYPGGKERELKYIRELIPPFQNYYEPFVGGGSVFLNIHAAKYFINDKSADLINLYRCIKTQNQDFILAIDDFDHDWQCLSHLVQKHSVLLLDEFKAARTGLTPHLDLLMQDTQWSELKILRNYNQDLRKIAKQTLITKLNRMLKLEQNKGYLSDNDILSNLEGALKSALYYLLREQYNHRQPHQKAGFTAALYLTVRELCYSSMFRFNAHGEFNVPYGGLSYNAKRLNARLNFYTSDEVKIKLSSTTLCCADFEEFLSKNPPSPHDFMFLDPPYDSDFSTYDQNAFTEQDQERLARYLIERCPCPFLLIIRNTPLIRELYLDGMLCANGQKLISNSFRHQYLVSFKNRNNRDTQHLLIANFNRKNFYAHRRDDTPSDQAAA